MSIGKLTPIAICAAILAFTACKSTKATSGTAGASSSASVTAPVAPDRPPAPDPVATAIAGGQNIYQGRCYQCHELPLPGDYNQSDWSQIMLKMSRKAHLSEAESDQVLAYINSIAKP